MLILYGEVFYLVKSSFECIASWCRIFRLCKNVCKEELQKKQHLDYILLCLLEDFTYKVFTNIRNLTTKYLFKLHALTFHV